MNTWIRIPVEGLFSHTSQIAYHLEGASRYRAAARTTEPPTAPPNAYIDPFTGASRYSGPIAETPPILPKSALLPVVCSPQLQTSSWKIDSDSSSQIL